MVKLSRNYWLLLFFAVIFFDFSTKQLVSEFGLGGLQVYENTGISFGLGSEIKITQLVSPHMPFSSPMPLVLVLLSPEVLSSLFWIGISGVCTFFMLRFSTRESYFSLSFFLGGVWANTLDRVFFGGVRDWIPVLGFGLYNNLADWALAFGCILWIYQYFSKIKT